MQPEVMMYLGIVSLIVLLTQLSGFAIYLEKNPTVQKPVWKVVVYFIVLIPLNIFFTAFSAVFALAAILPIIIPLFLAFFSSLGIAEGIIGSDETNSQYYYSNYDNWYLNL